MVKVELQNQYGVDQDDYECSANRCPSILEHSPWIRNVARVAVDLDSDQECAEFVEYLTDVVFLTLEWFHVEHVAEHHQA